LSVGGAEASQNGLGERMPTKLLTRFAMILFFPAYLSAAVTSR
jgi:hypothetical protein